MFIFISAPSYLFLFVFVVLYSINSADRKLAPTQHQLKTHLTTCFVDRRSQTLLVHPAVEIAHFQAHPHFSSEKVERSVVSNLATWPQK